MVLDVFLLLILLLNRFVNVKEGELKNLQMKERHWPKAKKRTREK